MSECVGGLCGVGMSLICCSFLAPDFTTCDWKSYFLLCRNLPFWVIINCDTNFCKEKPVTGYLLGSMKSKTSVSVSIPSVSLVWIVTEQITAYRLFL